MTVFFSTFVVCQQINSNTALLATDDFSCGLPNYALLNHSMHFTNYRGHAERDFQGFQEADMYKFNIGPNPGI